MLSLIIRAFAKLPLTWMYGISDFVALVLSYVYRRRVVLENISNAFPDKSKKDQLKIARSFYRNLTDVFFETIKSLHLNRIELGNRVNFLNGEILRPYAVKNMSVYILSSHQCNWEWMALASSFKLPMPVCLLYKPLKNKVLDQLMIEIRGKFGAELIDKDAAMMQLMRRRDKGRVIGILADQLPQKETNKFWHTFLNQDTAFYLGPEQLPKYTKYPVFFSHIWRTSRGYYNVELVPIAKPPYAHGTFDILPKYIEEAELLIRRYPANWLWSHKRWKYPKPEDVDKA